MGLFSKRDNEKDAPGEVTLDPAQALAATKMQSASRGKLSRQNTAKLKEEKGKASAPADGESPLAPLNAALLKCVASVKESAQPCLAKVMPA